MFRAFGRKTQMIEEIFFKKLKILEENSIEKSFFLLFLEMLLLNIEPWKIASEFYNKLFRLRGWGAGEGTVPCSPIKAPLFMN